VVITIMVFFLLLPLTIIGIQIKVNISKHIKETKRLYRKHRQKVCALLDVKEIKSFEDLSDEDVDKLITLSDDEWQEWDYLLKKAMVWADNNHALFNDYVDEFYPQIKSRNSYNSSTGKNMAIINGFSSNSSTGRIFTIINSLTLDELRNLCSETDHSWSHRAALIEKVKDIESKYPEGLKLFRSKHQSPSKSDIVRNLKLIQNYQALDDQHNLYLEWEEKQKRFSNNYYNRIREFRKRDGRYKYKFQIKEPQADGSFIDKNVEVWQGFVQSFGQYQLANSRNYFIDRLKELPEFKDKSRLFIDQVYDEIKGLVHEYSNESTALVVFITKNKYQWAEDVYEYHYRKLKNRLVEDETDFCDLEDLPQYCSKDSKYEYVIIFDLITTNDELINNCALVANFFSNILPCFGYYSLLKEYSFDELKKFKKEEYTLLTKSNYQKELDYIKNLFKLVNKNPYFSWFAITNTIIGSAHGSENVKECWLINSEEYNVKPQDKDGFISVTYNVPDCPHDSEFTLIGDKNNLDDVVRFTYELLSLMGIYDQFKENGQIAIEYINNHGYLRHR